MHRARTCRLGKGAFWKPETWSNVLFSLVAIDIGASIGSSALKHRTNLNQVIRVPELPFVSPAWLCRCVSCFKRSTYCGDLRSRQFPDSMLCAYPEMDLA